MGGNDWPGLACLHACVGPCIWAARAWHSLQCGGSPSVPDTLSPSAGTTQPWLRMFPPIGSLDPCGEGPAGAHEWDLKALPTSQLRFHCPQ